MGEPKPEYTAFKQRNPVGSYRRRFELPAGWVNRHVFVHFAGGESAVYGWGTGAPAGYSQGTRTPAEFDITAYTKPGTNQLPVQAYPSPASTYLHTHTM